MNKKEKAKELVVLMSKQVCADYGEFVPIKYHERAKQCALIAVDDQISFILEEMIQINYDYRRICIEELEELKEEIKQL